MLIVLVKKSNLSRWNGNGKYCFYWGSICCLRLWSDSALLWAGESRHWRWAVSLQLDYLPPPAGGGSSLCLHTGKSRGALWSFFYRFVMQYRLSFGPLSVSWDSGSLFKSWPLHLPVCSAELWWVLMDKQSEREDPGSSHWNNTGLRVNIKPERPGRTDAQ